ncbi:hypothetical protein BD626DRAFT_13752 [Schizophyllum amplum]|uniref:Uncharacterized protein n=1 Tax=Schizophyllum amplum TaxID=97359 RepID=A0A550CXK9_9AGAR|nr:hypothetical protein BD626DRAFT_13752 [Auriculariopsis ampla]
MSQSGDISGIVLLVEASAPVARVWPDIMSFVMPIIKRIYDSKPLNNIRIGVVIYGASDAPLLLSRFFADLQVVLHGLEEAHSSGPLSNYRPAATGKSGMAALDGIVAAIEMFDILARTAARPTFNHVLHIAGAGSNEADHPTVNEHPELDDMSWPALPKAFRDRDIHYSIIQPHSHNLSYITSFREQVSVYSLLVPVLMHHRLPATASSPGFPMALLIPSSSRDLLPRTPQHLGLLHSLLHPLPLPNVLRNPLCPTSQSVPASPPSPHPLPQIQSLCPPLHPTPLVPPTSHLLSQTPHRLPPIQHQPPVPPPSNSPPKSPACPMPSPISAPSS